jgi:tetratricopeptide (TPR) repeat protein
MTMNWSILTEISLAFLLTVAPQYDEDVGWDRLFARGEEAFRDGDPLAAKEAFSAALDVASSEDQRDDTISWLARVSVALGDLEDALKLYGELIAALAERPGQNQKHSLALSSRARVKERLGDYDAALSDLNSALEITRGFFRRGIPVAAAEMEIARHLQLRGMLDDAEFRLMRAFDALEGTASHRMEARVWERYAEILDLMGRTDEGARARRQGRESHRLADATQLPIEVLSPEVDSRRKDESR